MTQERDLRIKQYLETAALCRELSLSQTSSYEGSDLAIRLGKMCFYYMKVAANLFDRGDQ
jgi:hypothetical protein